jgi:hypothetical protein
MLQAKNGWGRFMLLLDAKTPDGGGWQYELGEEPGQLSLLRMARLFHDINGGNLAISIGAAADNRGGFLKKLKNPTELDRLETAGGLNQPADYWSDELQQIDFGGGIGRQTEQGFADGMILGNFPATHEFLKMYEESEAYVADMLRAVRLKANRQAKEAAEADAALPSE